MRKTVIALLAASALLIVGGAAYAGAPRGHAHGSVNIRIGGRPCCRRPIRFQRYYRNIRWRRRAWRLRHRRFY